MAPSPNFIYIVEDESAIPDSSDFSVYKKSESVNFTIPQQNDHFHADKSEFLLTSGEKVSLALQIATLPIVPAGLVTGGIAAGIGLKKLLATSSDLSENEKIQKMIAEEELTRFLENHAVTPAITREAGFSFPPGHPRTGTAYRLHPLAGHADESKNKLYIPHESFDELLFEEREAELVKLLVKLGATRISIKYLSSGNANGGVSGSIEAGNKVAQGGVSLDTHQASTYYQSWDREFLLDPQQETFDKIDEFEYAWLRFEPNWQAMLFAREHGGCTKASIELKEKTAFSSKSSGSIKFENPAVNGAINGESEKISDLDRNIFIEVEFISKAPRDRH